MYLFLSGAVAFGFFICGLFFLRFWLRSKDALYPPFAVAFVLLGLVQTVIALGDIPTEERGSIYLIRLAAFALILVAILRKNREVA